MYLSYITSTSGEVWKPVGTAEEAKSLFTDAFVEDLNLFVEAKRSLDRQAVHMAIGQ